MSKLPMTSRCAVLFIWLILLSALTAASPEVRAEQLLRECTSDSSAWKIGCLAYISGFMDGVTLQGEFTPTPRQVCFPVEGVSPEQVRRIVIKRLEDHPRDLHTSARAQVFIALRDAFPCKK